MAYIHISRQELLQLIVEEVDAARDILQLAEQLAPLLPIKSFDDLVRAEEKGRMRFRDTPFDIESLRAHIPAIAFPIEDARGLVERLGYLVQIVPEHLGVDTTSREGMRRQMRRSGMLAPGLGMVASRGLTAIVRDLSAELQSIPGSPGRADR